MFTNANKHFIIKIPNILDTYPNFYYKGDKTMKKRILSIVLAALMVVPFGALSVSAAKVTVPAEPTATGTAVVYTAYDYDENKAYPKAATTNDGSALDKLYNTAAFSSWIGLTNDSKPELGAAAKLKDGGYIVLVGKGYVSLGTNWDYTGNIPATTKPIVITGKDPANGTSYVSKNDDNSIKFMSDTGANVGQYGMFMMPAGSTEKSETLTFEGDVIFKDTVILNRSNAATVAAGKLAPVICAKSKIVIDSSVQFASMLGEQKFTLDVAEGAYAYLHALGFGKYTGKGTIVVGNEIVANVTADTFAGFEGVVVKADGTVLYGEVAGGNDQGGNNNQGGNADTSDMTWAVAVVAAVAVMACGVTVVAKKRED